ncbi:MAG: DEAD/DEAH box helicase family protein [Verrucomicrobiae bacterium]|nr:DEAD/DEAH box helicase family protein [Verrucomicrobiae bacterium]
MNSTRYREIETRLAAMEAERASLLSELEQLRTASASLLAEPAIPATANPSPQTPTEKADLFLRLFRARANVFPRLWENPRTGKKGYSPACRNEWIRGTCGKSKTKIKCSDCPHQDFLPLDQEAVLLHLRGKQTIGTYAIRDDNTCVFLAADFDGQGWQEDLLAYKRAAETLGVTVYMERSRSGEGAHAWIFFEEPVPAVTARRLGTMIIAKASANRSGMSLTTHDRFFPNQDILQRGGFGNLIALPLQHQPRQNGNTLFLDDALTPIEDPWPYLSNVRRLTRATLDAITDRILPSNPAAPRQQPGEENFTLISDEKALDLISASTPCIPFSGEVCLRHAAQISIPTAGMPSTLVASLKRLATFANPSFYELQRLRFSTHNVPRFIFCGEIQPESLLLPRGVLQQAKDLIAKMGGWFRIEDIRPAGERIAFKFHGQLLPVQAKAVKACLPHEHGVLVAPPGAGKTVMACAMVARRKARTLILVHRRPLLEQWKKQLLQFLGLGKKEIGVLKKGGDSAHGKVDLAMLQTIVKIEDAAQLFAQYGQVIIDECHHVPAVSFEAVLKQCASRHILGLTATPIRKDGLQKILFMQCGPIRHEIKDLHGGEMQRKVLVRPTAFRIVHESERPPIHLVWEFLVQDKTRTNLIVEDVVRAVGQNRRPLVLSDRKKHLAGIQEQLAGKLAGMDIGLFRIDSETGLRERREILAEIERKLATGGRFILLATSSLIGEGFDLPQLDTLFLAMPLSFKGRLIQYAGRLQRPCEGKREVVIYDYIEPANALTMSMYRKRLKAYRQMGYQVDTPAFATETHPTLFSCAATNASISISP